jgi:hypothetical protein
VINVVESSPDIRVGIGFATGRRHFRQVLNTYVHNWRQSGLTERDDVSLSLFVAYDLKYSNTRPFHYTNIKKAILDLLDDVHFIGSHNIEHEISYLLSENVIDEREARLFFGSGYAAQRNVVLYMALKHKIDYLLFLDDDEYPMAVTKVNSTAIWHGQEVLSTHLDSIVHADITNGHHCGYISPIPYMEFNEVMSENDFRLFIGAISNEVITWDSVRSVMNNGGATYADENILSNNVVEEVLETKKTKFITGANLCINLRNPERVHPFYNPPGARGEDTFLSTCLGDSTVLRVPCYTFHDGFSTYNHLIDGVLPITLECITADTDAVIDRFYKACIGWIRYKPLLMYITQRESYESIIEEMRAQLSVTLPKICAYFGDDKFMTISRELEKFHNKVERHYQQYLDTQQVWTKISEFLNSPR